MSKINTGNRASKADRSHKECCGGLADRSKEQTGRSPDAQVTADQLKATQDNERQTDRSGCGCGKRKHP